jgi:hypothetical protein
MLTFTPHRRQSGAPFAAASAIEGLSVNPFNHKIVMGEELGIGTGLAEFLDNREIPTNEFALVLTRFLADTERMSLTSRILQIATDFLTTGRRPSVSLQDGVVGSTWSTDGTDASTIGVSNLNMVMRSAGAGTLRVCGGAVPADNGAKLQVDGEITTANPLSGVGKWKLGQRQAGAVALDGTHFVEVAIGGVIVKLGIVV